MVCSGVRGLGCDTVWWNVVASNVRLLLPKHNTHEGVEEE